MKIKRHFTNLKIIFETVLSDPNRKSIIYILFEYFKYVLINRRVANLYFRKFFYRKGAADYSNYFITLKLQSKIWALNNTHQTTLMHDKYLFERFFEQNKIPVIHSAAYNTNSFFFINNTINLVSSIKEFLDFLNLLTKENKGMSHVFIKKKEYSLGGKHIYKIATDDLKKAEALVLPVFLEVIRSNYLFQPVIEQHEMMNKLHPYSLNTIRFVTYTNQEKIPNIFSCYLRIGMNKSYLDNVSSGGLFVAIDIETGAPISDGYSDIRNGRGRTYKRHRDSGILFKDITIPYFNEAKNVIREAAQLVPDLKVIGWDVAIQPQGPILIEGNSDPGMMDTDVAEQGYGNNPVFKELLKEL
jgi:hypothetical protein